MTNRQILVELLAMAIYNIDRKPENHKWHEMHPEDRELHRDMVSNAPTPETLIDLFTSEG